VWRTHAEAWSRGKEEDERERREAWRGTTFEFEGMHFEDGFRVDLLVKGIVVVELKSVANLAPPPNKS